MSLEESKLPSQNKGQHYPYIVSLKEPSMIHRAMGINIVKPRDIGKNINTEISEKMESEYIVQTVNAIELHKIKKEGVKDQVICRQPIYNELIALKKIKLIDEEKQIRQDFLFMMTKDLKMHILHFNSNERVLEIISTYKIDPSILGASTSKLLKEISYISYYQNLRSLVILFTENYVLTVNMEVN